MSPAFSAIWRLSSIMRPVWARVMPWTASSHDPSQAQVSPFEGLQHVLRVATQCPSGPAGDDIRRAACELIEADSDAARHSSRRRMLKAIATVEWRRSRGRSRADDPCQLTTGRLTQAVRLDLS